jgi:hypothetical protein
MGPPLGRRRGKSFSVGVTFLAPLRFSLVGMIQLRTLFMCCPMQRFRDAQGNPIEWFNTVLMASIYVYSHTDNQQINCRNQQVLGRTNNLLSFHNILGIWYDTDRIENTVSGSSSIDACVFVAARTCLPSRCLSTLCGIRRQEGYLISHLHFFQNKESRLKRRILSVKIKTPKKVSWYEFKI